MFYLKNDRTDSYYCRNGKATPDPSPVFPKFLTPGPKEECRILPKVTPVIRISSHLWYGLVRLFQSAAASLLLRMTEVPAYCS